MIAGSEEWERIKPGAGPEHLSMLALNPHFTKFAAAARSEHNCLVSPD